MKEVHIHILKEVSSFSGELPNSNQSAHRAISPYMTMTWFSPLDIGINAARKFREYNPTAFSKFHTLAVKIADIKIMGL